MHGRFFWYDVMTTDTAAARKFYSEVIGCLDWIAENPALPRLRQTLFICDSNLPNRAGFFRGIQPLTLSLPAARELPTPSSRYAARNRFLPVVE